MKDFENIIGYESVKKELRQISDVLKNKEFYEKLGVRAPRGLLLYGEPGVGKSLMATSLIEASGRKAFVCRKNKPDGEFVDEIKRVFDEAAAAAPSIVFLDDMDKFANGDERHPDAEEYVTVQSCIDEVKDKEVFVVATANSLRALPESLLRTGRFDRTIKIYAPKGSDADKIIHHYLSKKKVAFGLDAYEISRFMSGHSCAELETVVNEAGIFAGFERSDVIKMEHFIKAFLLTIHDVSFDDVSKTELNADITDPREYITNVVYHEAGHAAIQEILFPGSVSLVSAYGEFGEKGGFTVYNDEGKGHIDDVYKKIICGLGGRAAVELRLGVLDTGAESDFDKVFSKCRSLVKDACISGLALHSSEWNDSEKLKAEQEVAVSRELDRYYMKAKEILAANMEFFESIAYALAEKGVITFEDINEIKDACIIVQVGI